MTDDWGFVPSGPKVRCDLCAVGQGDDPAADGTVAAGGGPFPEARRGTGGCDGHRVIEVLGATPDDPLPEYATPLAGSASSPTTPGGPTP